MKQFIILISLVALTSCDQKPGPLPYIGDRTNITGETEVHSIRPYSLTNQFGKNVTNETYAGKMQVVDFFFTYCPSICPIVKSQMLRIQEYVEAYDDIMLISHTLDPKRDSVKVLHEYAEGIGADHDKWHFLWGDKDLIYDLAVEDYFVAALESAEAPGGIDHSGKILLLDKDARIRGFCDGTDPTAVDKFMKTIDVLRNTYN